MWMRLVVMAILARPGVVEQYRVVDEESRFEVEVGRAGLFKMFGHDHRIRVGQFTGTVEWNADEPETAHFVLRVDAASLEVADEELNEDDRVKVQRDMETKALALAEHPIISFTSTRVRVQDDARLVVEGTLDLRGTTAPIEVPLILTSSGERIVVAGELELDSEKWGVPQISALGGSVKTKEELELTFEIVAVRR